MFGGYAYQSRKGSEIYAVAVLKWDNKKNLEGFLARVETEPFQRVLREATVIGNPETHILEDEQQVP